MTGARSTAIALFLLLGTAIANIALGAVPIPLATVFDAVGHAFGSGGAGAASGPALVLWSIRLPRIALGMLVGAALAVAGALLQAVFRNPLADPALTGASGGAAVGAASVLVLGAGGLGPLALTAAAFLGAVTAAATVFLVARAAGPAETLTLILAGVAVNALTASALGALTFVTDETQLRNLTFWTMGSMGGATWRTVGLMAVLVGAGVAASVAIARALDLYQLGEAEAGHLGIDPGRLRLGAVALASLLVGGAVAFTGIVAFIGLVVPHLVRLWLGPRHGPLLPMAALVGATLLSAADLLARTAVAPAEMPIGIITSAVGAPVFIALLVGQTRARGV